MAWFDSGWVQIGSYGSYTVWEGRHSGNANRTAGTTTVNVNGHQQLRARNTAGGSTTYNNPVDSNLVIGGNTVLGTAAIKGSTSGNIAGVEYTRAFNVNIGIAIGTTAATATSGYSVGSFSSTVYFDAGYSAPGNPSASFTNIGPYGATANLSVSGWGQPATGRFMRYYGTTSGTTDNYLVTTVGSATSYVDNLTGLQDNTTYYYRVATTNGQLSNPNGLTQYTFTTHTGIVPPTFEFVESDTQTSAVFSVGVFDSKKSVAVVIYDGSDIVRTVTRVMSNAVTPIRVSALPQGRDLIARLFVDGVDQLLPIIFRTGIIAAVVDQMNTVVGLPQKVNEDSTSLVDIKVIEREV